MMMLLPKHKISPAVPASSSPAIRQSVLNTLPGARHHERAAFIAAAMSSEDKDADKLFADVFEKLRINETACIYWKYLREQEDGKRGRNIDDPLFDMCSVM